MKHQLVTKKLSSGSELLIINIPNAQTVYFGVFLRSGNRYAPKDKFELPHLLEHLAFEGNKHYPDPIEYRFELEKHGAYNNAYTNMWFNWFETIGNMEELNDAIKLTLYQVFEPIHTQRSIDYESQTIINELSRKLNTDRKKINYKILQTMYGNKFLGIKKRIESVERIKRQDLVEYFERFYGTKNSFIVLAGSFSDQEMNGMAQKIDSLLHNYNRGVLREINPVKLSGNKKVFTMTSSSPNQTAFQVRFSQAGLNKDDLPVLQVLQTIYSHGQSSRMHIKARQAGLTYGLSSWYGSDIDGTEFVVEDQTSDEKLMPLFEMAVTELQDIVSGNFSDKEFERAVGYQIGQIKRSYQTPINYADWYWRDFILGIKLTSPESFISQIKKVSREDIVGVGQKYIKNDNWILGLSGRNVSSKKEALTNLLEKTFIY